MFKPGAQIQINPRYAYDLEDISSLLPLNLFSYSSKYPNVKDPIEVTPSVELSSSKTDQDPLVAILQQQKAKTGARIVIIPCYSLNSSLLDTIHWVGIVLKFDASGELNVYHMNSLIESTLPRDIQERIEVVFPDFNFTEFAHLQQSEMHNTGPLMLENLMLAAFNLKATGELNIPAFRLQHLELLKNMKHDRYAAFYLKQQGFEASTPSVSQELDLLFKTVVSMQHNSGLIFGNDVATQGKAATATELDNRFNTVCDANGNLKLQFKPLVENRNITGFLYTPSFTEDPFKFMLAYAYPEIGGIIGVTFSVVRGAGAATAAAAAREGAKIGIAQALGAAATVFDPPVLAATAVYITGSVVSASQARAFAGRLKEAYDLYTESGFGANKERLRVAEKILSDEFETNGLLSIGYKITRWPSTPALQFEFAHLLWAQIKAKLNDPAALTKFHEVYTNSSNPTIRAMSLIGQLGILAQELNGGKNISGFDSTNRLLTIDALAAELNRNHADIVKKYLDCVRIVYNNLLSLIIKCNRCILDEEYEVSSVIESVINFRDLHCLRYLRLNTKCEPIGKVSEVLFTFAQALSYNIRAIRIDNKTDGKANNEQYDKEIDLALKKMQACEDLIKLFALELESRDSPLLKGVLKDITGYIKVFRDNHVLEPYEPVNAESETPESELKSKSDVPAKSQTWMYDVCARVGVTVPAPQNLDKGTNKVSSSVKCKQT